jgi:hypothetical protein
VNASVGDTIAFTFLSKNHTVTQSTFASPCTNLSGTGIDSGFVFVPNNATSFQQFSFTLNNASAPLWFYCRQTGHCEQGMVFAVNPNANKTFSAFQAAAMASSSSGSGSPTSGTTGAPGAPGAPGATTTGTSSTPSSAAIKLGGTTGLLSLAGLVAGILL